MTQIVHIGFPKTATTFLQWSVFPHLEGVHYVDYAECRKIFQPIIYADPLDYSIQEVKSMLIESDETTLYSFESLAGSPFYFKGIGRSSIPTTLKSLGFDKLIITIREQTKAIDSYYRQYVVQGCTLSFKNWLDMGSDRPIPQKYFQMGYLKYDGLLAKYVEAFGKENVLVLSQELLHENDSNFIHQITKFTNSTFNPSTGSKKANASLTNLSILILRLINHFTFSSVRPFHLISKRISNRPIWKLFAVILDPYFIRLFSSRRSYIEKYNMVDDLCQVYQDSNERLKEEWGIDYTKNKK